MYRIVLWLLALVFLVALFSCAAGSNDGRGDSTRAATPETSRKDGKPFVLLLAGTEARDSAAIINDFFVDQALRQALDSIPAAKYLTVNYRDSLADLSMAAGKQGVPLKELAEKLDLDGVIYTRAARFGSVLAIDLRIIDPRTQGVLFRDVVFSLIRYRDTSGTMFLGPTLYDCVRKSVGRYFGVPHTETSPIATVPLVIAGLEIPKDDGLGRISVLRQTLSTEAVKALGEYARLHFPELMAFDYESRNQVYRLINVAAVDDYQPMNAAERQVLYGVGIDRYLTGSVAPDGDSMRTRLELRMMTSATRDSVLDVAEQAFSKTHFENSKTEEEFVVAMIDLVEQLYKREAERVRTAYQNTIAGKNPSRGEQ